MAAASAAGAAGAAGAAAASARARAAGARPAEACARAAARVSAPSLDSPPVHAAEVFESAPGEEFLFQAGETLRIEALPAGTRVVYGGVRARTACATRGGSAR